MRSFVAIPYSITHSDARFIYKLVIDAGLPWVYGGEYSETIALVLKVVQAWLAVGLVPVFVFDGEDIRILYIYSNQLLFRPKTAFKVLHLNLSLK